MLALFIEEYRPMVTDAALICLNYYIGFFIAFIYKCTCTLVKFIKTFYCHLFREYLLNGI